MIHSKRYIYCSRQIKRCQISTNNGKIFQVLGVTNVSQISGWENIKKTSNYVNAVFINSEYPKKAYFAFAFETTDLHNLLNFGYSLLDDEGKLIKFKENEDKILVLNFSIEVIKMLKVKKLFAFRTN